MKIEVEIDVNSYVRMMEIDKEYDITAMCVKYLCLGECCVCSP